MHVDKSQLPRDYVWSRTELPDQIPRLWPASLTEVSSCQAAGRRWVREGNDLAVQVPSVVIPDEFNILLNPKHAGYPNLIWTQQRPFQFDPRLFVAEPQNL